MENEKLRAKQQALLNHSKFLIEQLKGNAEDIDWKIIIRLAEAIKQTSESAMELDINKKYIKR